MSLCHPIKDLKPNFIPPVIPHSSSKVKHGKLSLHSTYKVFPKRILNTEGFESLLHKMPEKHEI